MIASLLNRLPGRFETSSFLLFYLLCRIRFRYYTENQIRDYQKRRTTELLKYATSRSPFYRKYYTGKDLNDFNSLPVTNKKMMMENLSEFNTVGLSKEEIIDFCLETERNGDYTRRLKGLNIGMSSGTSGNKGVEIVTRKEERYMKAALFARFDIPKRQKLNIAFILRVTAPAFNINFLGHKLTWISQILDLATIRKKLGQLNPNVISAPPSMLKLIAGEVESGRLKVNPARVVSYAEVLHPDVKEYLQKVFGCSIHEIYKATEGPIAISCRYGSLHINEDLVLAETLDDEGNVTLPGTPCRRMIITDLHKLSQPIIRYGLNDIITVSPAKCPCGSSFRVIERIQGREDDLFWGKKESTEELQYIFPDYISRAVISSSEEIDEFQVVQESPSLVRVILKLREGRANLTSVGEAVRKNISGVFAKYNCILPDVITEYGDPAPNSSSGKLIRIYRKFNPDNYDRTKAN